MLDIEAIHIHSCECRLIENGIRFTVMFNEPNDKFSISWHHSKAIFTELFVTLILTAKFL